jgi:hypothetical protein
VELDPPLLPPPQPILRAAVASRTNPKQAEIQTPLAASFLLMNPRGSRRIGSRMNPEAAPETVSVKTTVI